jgi:hypothetical protein
MSPSLVSKLLSQLRSQPDQQPLPVCTWSAHAPQSGLSKSPFPRQYYSLSATPTAAGELLLFGGKRNGTWSDDLYVISTRNFSTTLLQTSGEVPGPRGGHKAALTSTNLLIWGGDSGDRLLDDSLRVLNLGTSYLLMSRPTSADQRSCSPVSREWTRIVANGPGPCGRYRHTVTMVGSKLFIFGGQLYYGNFLNDMWALDLNSRAIAHCCSKPF